MLVDHAGVRGLLVDQIGLRVLSSANGTTAGATLSPCITATYVPVAPPWRFAIIRGYTLTLHKDRVFPVGVREKIVWRGYRQR
jgi:hypothetical protein